MDETEDIVEGEATGATQPATQTRPQRLFTRHRPGNTGGLTVSITRAGLEAIELLARNGANDAEIARQLGIGRDALRGARQRDAEVDEAIARGRSRLDQEFVDRFVEWSRNGHVVASMFFAKTRLGWREDGANAPALQINGATTVNLNIGPALTDDQFRALLAPPQAQEARVIDADVVQEETSRVER